MKVLLVDNGTIRLEGLKKLIPGTETVVTCDKLESGECDADLVVLSGSSEKSLAGNEDFFAPEMDLVFKRMQPIIGICFGSELIARAFGGELELMDERHKGIITIKKDYKEFPVYESHRWRIKKLPSNFEVLATSAHGIEMFRHTGRPIVGFQFHPEHLVDQTMGDELFGEVFRSFQFKS